LYDFKKGNRCQKCKGKTISQLKKHSYEFVEQEFIKRGFVLLDSIYVDSDTPMNYICSCGNKSKIRIKCVMNGTKCMKCSRQDFAEKLKHSFDLVKSTFTQSGCVLLSECYINSNTPLEYICSCGNKSTIRFSDFKKGRRCRSCQGSRVRQNMVKDTITMVNVEFNRHGCTLLETEYKNRRTPMKYICVCGEESVIKYSSFLAGCRCEKCRVRKLSGSNAKNWVADREEFARRQKFMKQTRTALARTIKGFALNKTSKTAQLMGYDHREFTAYMENHPDYAQVVEYCKTTGDTFSLDHIFPVKAFVDYGLVEERHIKIVNHFSNLRPMPLSKNIKKSDIYNKEDFERWIKDFPDFTI
jgi:hypothetical protein